jgi:hypothetical protein
MPAEHARARAMGKLCVYRAFACMGCTVPGELQSLQHSPNEEDDARPVGISATTAYARPLSGVSPICDYM